MLPTLTAGASLIVKMVVDGEGKETTLGFASRLQYSVQNGQKLIFTVDSPFPEEIAQGASQSFVRGSMTLYLLRGQTLEAMDMAHFRHSPSGESLGPMSKYFNLRVYDRHTNGKVLSLDFCKFSGYTIDMAARSIVTANVTFEGMYASPGDGLT
jgi:hypothetical protein